MLVNPVLNTIKVLETLKVSLYSYRLYELQHVFTSLLDSCLIASGCQVNDTWLSRDFVHRLYKSIC